MSDKLTNASEKEAMRSNQPAEGSVGLKMLNEASKIAKENIIAPKSGSACIQDSSGYIDCGPIVGYPRPDNSGVAQPEIPLSPLPLTPNPEPLAGPPGGLKGLIPVMPENKEPSVPLTSTKNSLDTIAPHE